MVIRKTDDFLQDLERLPAGIQELLRKQEAIFRGNWLDPRLHTKRIESCPASIRFASPGAIGRFSIGKLRRRYFSAWATERMSIGREVGNREQEDPFQLPRLLRVPH